MALSVSSLVAIGMLVSVHADIYMQNPRGSNNRLDGKGRDRSNANRLFDSQNNARGGYNVGGLAYYTGSELTIEWTNQHSCGGPNNNCELVIQYMCSNTIRNGVNEKTINFPFNKCENNDCDKDLEYGMHESYNYYENCYIRERNKGLYTADQNMKSRNTARYTRQDNAGTRYGYECPEERDYFPYWHPTPWKDIVVMTNDVSRCDYYKNHSQNVADKWICNPVGLDKLPDKVRTDLNRYFSLKPVPQTEDACKSYKNDFRARDANNQYKIFTITGSWDKVKSHNIPPPECIKSPTSRDNHLGNGKGGFANTYNWTIPDDVHENCALRMRYNISTGEFPWETDHKSNGQNKNKKPCKACVVNLGDQVGIDEWDAQDRGYILTGNPNIHPLSIDGDIQSNFELKLAVNTDQYGRTFEDRSHTFGIKKRPEGVPASDKIYNLNVRGKRGNIVQTYPATEYDYVPNQLHINEGDRIHIQWTGSDDNPGNNDGEGEAGTDRSNIILLSDPKYRAVIDAKADRGHKYGHWANSYPENINNGSFLGLGRDDLRELVHAGSYLGGSLVLLNENGPNFDLGLRQCKKPGVYRYMCTRNNNFSNRGQKGVVIVHPKNKKDEEVMNEENSIEEQLQEDLKPTSPN